MVNKNLHAAKKQKNNEFYTQLTDIGNELRHYKDHFKDKVIFCNCDDPEESNFWFYFAQNFERLGLKKLISTHFEAEEPSYKLEIVRDINDDGKIDKLDVVKTPLKQNGDFRSSECIDLLKKSDIVVTNPPFSCYSSDTEVFTNNGWKLFKDVVKSDLVYSLNLESNIMEYVGIKAFYNKTVCENLLKFKNRRLDLLVTKNHRMIARGVGGRHPVKVDAGNNELLIRADEVKDWYTMPIKGFEWVGNDVEYHILPAIMQKEQYTRKEIIISEKKIDMKYWLEFFGFWLADGCCICGKNTQGNQKFTVSIKQNERNDAYVKQLYRNIGFECKVEKNRSGNHNYTVYSKQLWEWLISFGKSHDKYIPNEYLMLNKTLLGYLYKGYINGDSHGNDNQFHIGTVSKRLAENLQELLLKYDGRLVQFKKINMKYKGEPYEYYQGNFSKNDLQHNLKYGVAEEVLYDGEVYCLELNVNGTMLVRRNGVVSWSGNCFREYVTQLVEYNRKFLIIGNKNAITYKEIFKLIQDNKIWLGNTSPKEFTQPDGTITKSISGLTRWFTNLETKRRHEDIILYKTYNPIDYPKYDNYDAINVDKVKDIPIDYAGCMGVPITFLDHFVPEQFEIIKFRKGNDEKDLVYTINNEKKYPYFRIIIRNKRLGET